MANRDAPIGFRTYGPVKSLRPYDIESATAVYINDLIAHANDGYVDAAAAGGTEILGSGQQYHAANAGITTIIVADDPYQLFLCQDNAGATLSIANQGEMGNHEAGSGSSTTLLSGHELDGSTVSAAQDGFTILDLDDRPDNAWGTWCDLIVSCDEHFLRPGGTALV